MRLRKQRLQQQYLVSRLAMHHQQQLQQKSMVSRPTHH
jgi:hypothetical protein